jgi:hypothetical protein
VGGDERVGARGADVMAEIRRTEGSKKTAVGRALRLPGAAEGEMTDLGPPMRGPRRPPVYAYVHITRPLHPRQQRRPEAERRSPGPRERKPR